MRACDDGDGGPEDAVELVEHRTRDVFDAIHGREDGRMTRHGEERSANRVAVG
jgi:hypothetical protein